MHEEAHSIGAGFTRLRPYPSGQAQHLGRDAVRVYKQGDIVIAMWQGFVGDDGRSAYLF
jgi:hypothetical protein